MNSQDKSPFSLEGKTILVTGASSGIGKATAVECARQGAIIYLVARDSARLEETGASLEGEGHQIVKADLTDDEQVKALVKSLPVLDGVVLCAGKGMTLPVQFSDRAKFNEIFEINFFATAELLRLLYKGKKITKGGSAVLISSMGGTHVFNVGNGIYGTSKAALDSFMKFAAKEFAARKIRVNSICPAMIDTPLIHKGTITEDEHAEDMKRYSLKRYGKPEEVAYAAIFLLSDASEWITGTSLIVDGGLSIR